ncbi:nicotinate-nucleotide pyrophosphorylase (carboxylating) [Candidatus Ruthia magnifica str. Cm (Calyptogena magnifica)]|uniref:Probable nicotinate-nucleotide pyrophosphorylase [carboxylating] n=1 Tax=Ruthia magnifica subsp. Calyptogena magnifica TaxID=413404 RepID=A1AVE5_RUTMC|nr:carboxylating nicotinate-nucleotide diphosphorylase [Candidatus Ruthturnera calyptogenae]ABL01902.1 nicotinate-nucleotide pyrophosphorylase (carboxylating) [Candidatus Ruthia magnifica str. Cm (Calyptogena magnifica)]
MNLSTSKYILDSVALALAEDFGTGDVSADLFLNKTIISAEIISREFSVICGIEYAQSTFLLLDDKIKLDWKIKDGECISSGQILCILIGSSKAIISAERVALNFLQMLSSVATKTHDLVSKINHTNAQLIDTRKTIPGLRLAQKYAVKCGGGVNHRMGLYDCVMLKENHIIALGSITLAVKLAIEQYPNLPLIVEVEDLSQLQEVLILSGVARVLCDNFSISDLIQAVGLAKGKLPLEASGNINENNIVEVANTGVDFISTGSITKNIQAIDLSLRFI